MSAARKSLIGIVALMLLSVLLTVLDGARAPQGTGREHDSFGILGHGMRGLYETLETLGMDVDRIHVPPSAVDTIYPGANLVLWAPKSHRIRNELRHIEQLGQWVREGGRLIVAPATDNGRKAAPKGRENLFKHLGLKSHIFFEVDAYPCAPMPNEALPNFEKSVWNGVLDESAIVKVIPRGKMATLLRGVNSLVLPGKSIITLGRGGDLVSPDRLEFIDKEGKESTLIAALPLGKGEIVVVADPRLAVNKFLGLEDNAVAMTLLMRGESGSIVFDEFLHGIGSRGNPVHLLSRRPYGYIALGFLLTAMLWCWRSAIFLGPPLPEGRTPRRDISDYINAMANLFMKKKAYRFALSEVRKGVMRRLAKKYHLPPAKTDANSIAKAMSKRDPKAAKRFTESVAAVDTILKRKREPSAKRLAQTTREFTKCQ
jgi:hypothetical protein